jgi:GAF domain-containing protein
VWIFLPTSPQASLPGTWPPRLSFPATDKVLGVLAVYNKQENLPFDDWDKEILEAVSPPASMAIKQAWLYQNLIKSIDEVVETNKQLEEANQEVRQRVKELNWLKSKVAK